MKFRPRTYATITAIVAALSMLVFFNTPVVAAEPPYFLWPTQTSQEDDWTDMEENRTFTHDKQAILWTDSLRVVKKRTGRIVKLLAYDFAGFGFHTSFEGYPSQLAFSFDKDVF